MANVIEMTVKMYDARGFVQPWLAYVVLVDDEVVGTCAFTAAPDDGRVEIAYYTFPSFEGRGVATAMARELIAIARADGIAVFAHTLPQRARATTILERLGFAFAGSHDHPEDGVISLGAPAVRRPSDIRTAVQQADMMPSKTARSCRQ